MFFCFFTFLILTEIVHPSSVLQNVPSFTSSEAWEFGMHITAHENVRLFPKRT